MDDTIKLKVQSILESAMIDVLCAAKQNPQQTHEQTLQLFMQSVLEQLQSEEEQDPLERLERQLEDIIELEKAGKISWR